MTSTRPPFYTITIVHPDWVVEGEPMGSKEKFWFRSPDDQVLWLFKYPQMNTGQHWAEMIAAEIAEHLGILHATVNLATFQAVKGSATKSFARHGCELFHGNQVLEGNVFAYDPAKKFRQSSHTLENIFAAIDTVFAADGTAEAAKRQIAEYLILDALIGNTDRHHENWGILVNQKGRPRTRTVAPSFDHASSLGRELLDDARARILHNNDIPRYSRRAPGAIYWREADKRGISPIDLVRRATEWHPHLFRPVFALLDKLEGDTVKGIVARIPPDWMSDLARDFVIELAHYNLNELRAILQ